MSKRKSKQRKGKLARPPKKKAAPPTPDHGMSGPLPAELWEELSAGGDSSNPLDMPPAIRNLNIHPSLYDSPRFLKFTAICEEIRASVPQEKKTFNTFDVENMKLRRWLIRYANLKKAGSIASWQVKVLENIGFDWVSGRDAHPPRPPKPPKQALRKKKTEADLAAEWDEAFEALRKNLEGGDPAVRLVRGPDAQFLWFNKQIRVAAQDALTSDQKDRLQSLGLKTEEFGKKTGLGSWQRTFNKYFPVSSKESEKSPASTAKPETETETETEAVEEAQEDFQRKQENWFRRQKISREKGKLMSWQLACIDSVADEWKELAESVEQGGNAKMEARWYQKFEKYLNLEAIHGKPLPVALIKEHKLLPFVSRMREYYLSGKIRPEIIKDFEAKGFIFCRKEARNRKFEAVWNKNFAKLRKFKERYGHAMVPSGYAKDPEFGVWFARQRTRYTQGKLNPKQAKQFADIGVPKSRGRRDRVMTSTQIIPWERRFDELRNICQTKHEGKIPGWYDLDIKSRFWLRRQWELFQEGKLDPWQIGDLASLGVDEAWMSQIPEKGARPPYISEGPRRRTWLENLESYKAFVAETGKHHVPYGYPDKALNSFAQRMRRRFRTDSLSSDEYEALKQAGFVFVLEQRPTEAWMAEYEKLKLYRARHGHSNVTRAYPPDQALAEFVAQQKQRGRKGMLLAEHIRLLNELDFPWVDGVQPTPKAQSKD